MRMPSASHSDSIAAVVSGVVRPGSSSMESSRKYCLPTSVVKAFSRAARYLSSRRFIFSSAGQTYASSFENSASFEGETDRRHARAHAIDEICRNVRLHPCCRVGGRLRLRELGRQVEGDVAGKHAAPDQCIFARVELAADGLVIGVEAPCDSPAMKAGLELRQHAAVAHALDALALMPLGHARADERERHRVEPPLEHRVDVEHQLTGMLF